jgi:hypothetical protein
MSAYNTLYTFSQKVIIIFLYIFVKHVTVHMPLGFFVMGMFIGT